MVKLIRQIDRHEGAIVAEWWILDGVPYHLGQQLKGKGFVWIKGPDGGAWVTKHKENVQPLIDAGMEVITIDPYKSQ